MLYITISITLLIILATVLLLAKVKKDGADKFLSWVCYSVLIISYLTLFYAS
jgi:hypothetical protein